MRFSDFLLVSDPQDLDFIVGYSEEQNIRIDVSDFFAGQINGSGTPGYIPVFTAANVIGNSQIFQHGSNIVVGGVDSLGYKLAVSGTLYSSNGAVINSATVGADALTVVGGDGNIFIIPNDIGQSISSLRRIIHPPAILTTESATLGQLNAAISNLDGEIDILLALKVDKTSVGAVNGVASLDSGGKVPLSQIPDSIIGQVEYMGTWNAFTNTPTLNPLVPEEKGHYYVVSAAGVFGGKDYQIGDWIISNGIIWEKVDNTDSVTSVFGRIGAILALEGDYQAFYPRLSQAYDNPSFINSLAYSKITGVPPFLLENQTITLSGDVTGTGKTSINSTISNNVVSNEKLRDSLGTSVIGRAASSTGDPGDIQASTDGQVLLRSAGNLLFGLISSDSISSIDWSKITNTPTTLLGYGITNAYTKTESDNKFVPYNSATGDVNLNTHNITANSFIKQGGTSAQFLKADGSIDLNQYVPTTRSINSGAGLTGGGNLSSDITLAFDTAYGDNRYAYRTRQLTINGTTFDLSADRSWSVGTVTSVGLSAPTGFSVSNSPITTSGTLALTFATGYSLPTNVIQATWDTAYNNSIVSAEVTGTETKLLTLNQQDGGTITASWSDFDTAPVTSVFGRLGAIIALSGDYNTSQVTENVNLYFTNDRARSSISLTTTGVNGPATYNNTTGVFNIPNYTTDLSGFVPYTGANQTVNLNTQQLQAGQATFTSNGSADSLTVNHTSGSGTGISVTKSGSGEGLIVVKSSGSGNAASITGGITLLSQLNLTTALDDIYISSSSNWNTAYNNRITSLTTTGTSGAASLVNHVLNIPIYQAQGNYITSLTGEATASGPGAASVTLTNSAVIGKVLTGLTVSGSSVVSTDSILTAFGKLQGQVNDLIGGLKYEGTWNALTNTPTITSGVGIDGVFYIVSVAGNTNIDGIIDWEIGDWIVFHDTAWQKVDNTESVVSVNGFTGAVTLTTSNIAEGTNLYFTDTRSRQAISLTNTGNSGVSTYNNGTGVFNVPQYTLTGLGGVPLTRSLTINGVTFDLSSDRSYTVGNVRTDSSYSNPAFIASLAWGKITNTPTTLAGYGISDAYTQTQVNNLLAGYVTLGTDQTITGLKTIIRSGDVLNFKIGTDTLYGLKIAYNQNELVPSGEATWSFVNTFNREGAGFEVTPISFFRGVLVTGERLLTASINSNLLDYYANNPSGRYPIYTYNTGVQQFSTGIIVGKTTGVVTASTGAISDLPSGVVANFNGRVIGSNAVNSNEFVTLSQLGSYVPTSRTLTINGVTFDLSANRSWTITAGVSSFNTRTGAITLLSADVTGALGFTPYNASNPAGYTSNLGTVTSVAGTGTVSGLTLTGTVTSSGSITLGGALSLTSANVTNALGYTPVQPNGTGASGTWGINITGNAETVDGFSASQSTVANAIVVRDPSGYIFGNYINLSDDGNPGAGTAITSFITKQGDNYYRSVSPTNAMSSIRGVASGTWGISITGNAATVGTFTETAFAVNQRDGDISSNATIDSSSLRNGMYRVNSGVTSSPNSGRFWALNVYGNQNNVVSQLASDFQTGETFVRSYNSAWSSWRRVIDTINYNSYSPTLTGGGASGTWGISITGTAGSETLATVTNRGSSTTSQVEINRQNSINATTPGVTTGYGIHLGGQTTADLATGITFSSGNATPTNANAGIYVQGSGAYGSRMYIATTDSYATGSKTAITINEAGNVTFNRGTIQNGSVWINNGANFNSYNENIRLFNAPNGVSVIAFSASGVGGTPTTSILGYSDRMEFRYGNGAQFRIYDGYTESMGTSRAPAFMDSNDTAYYADFNATSNSAIRLRGGMLVGPNTTWGAYLQVGGNGNQNTAYTSVVSTNGNLHIDPANSCNTYINYYVNGLIYLNGDTYSISSNGSFYNGRSANSDAVGGFGAGTFYRNIGFGAGFPSWDLNTVEPDRSGFTYGNGAPYTGPFIHIGASGYGLQFNAPYTGGGYGLAFRTRNGDNGTWNPYRYPAIYGININGGGDLYATIYYDQNNTGYYVDPASGSLLNTLTINDWYYINGASGMYWNSYGRGFSSPEQNGNPYGHIATYGTGRNGWSGYGIGSQFAFMGRSGTDVGLFDTGVGWIWYSLGSTGRLSVGTSGTDGFSRLYVDGIGSATSSFRSPIFYDSNDTTYYIDGDSGSLLNGLVSRSYLTASNCNFAATGNGGQVTITANIGTFGGYVRSSQHLVLDNTNGGYHVYVTDSNGTGVVKFFGAQSWSAQSDGRIKTIHSTLENNLSKLDTITPIYYSFNNFDDDRNRIGLIAQEVQAHFPELVSLDPMTENLTLDYTGLIPVLLGAIKELKNEVEILKTQLL